MRVDLQIEKPEEPEDWIFSGLPVDYGTALLLYQAYRDHHVLPLAGGALDQPAWWWDMVRLLNRIYYTRQWVNLPEAEAAAEARAKERLNRA